MFGIRVLSLKGKLMRVSFTSTQTSIHLSAHKTSLTIAASRSSTCQSTPNGSQAQRMSLPSPDGPQSKLKKKKRKRRNINKSPFL